jgi:hypothetical protein
MLQKIVFQDNIFQLSRSIDTVNEGLMLDLSPDYFFDKTVDDLLFFDASIQKIFSQLQSNPRISGYIHIMHSLLSCQNRFLQLVDSILQSRAAMKEEFEALLPKLQTIRNQHTTLNASICETIVKCDKNNDSRDIVSQNELSELLNF